MVKKYNRFLFQRFFGILLVLWIALSAPPSFPYHLEWIMASIGGVLLLCGLIGRIYATLYIGELKSSKLICEGPYLLCRNPLYFFSFLSFLGILFLNLQISVILVATPIYLWIYYCTIRQEEEFLKQKLQDSDYLKYLQEVPRFLPSFKNFSYPEVLSVHIKGIHKELKNILAWIGLTLTMIILNWLQSVGVLPTLVTSL